MVDLDQLLSSKYQQSHRDRCLSSAIL